MAEIIFTEGLIFKDPRQTAPSFVKGSLSIKVSEFKAFLDKYEKNGWVNLDFKESKGGKKYFSLNTYVKGETNKVSEEEKNQKELNNLESKTVDTIEYPEEEIDENDIPF